MTSNQGSSIKRNKKSKFTKSWFVQSCHSEIETTEFVKEHLNHKKNPIFTLCIWNPVSMIKKNGSSGIIKVSNTKRAADTAAENVAKKITQERYLGDKKN